MDGMGHIDGFIRYMLCVWCVVLCLSGNDIVRLHTLTTIVDYF